LLTLDNYAQRQHHYCAGQQLASGDKHVGN
jgi:hypothetical protein